MITKGISSEIDTYISQTRRYERNQIWEQIESKIMWVFHG